MSAKSMGSRGDGNRNEDRNEMDVEGALALDLAELEAMLAIDSEQVRYDEQVKKRDFQARECRAVCSSAEPHSSHSSQFEVESNSEKRKRSISQNEIKKLRKRKDAKGRVSKETELPPLSLTNEDKLESADSSSDGAIASPSKEIYDKIHRQDSADSRDSLTVTTPSSKIDYSSSLFAKPTPPDDLKRRNPRIYSYSPISRTRLTVPKRQFSPEPTRKNPKILVGPRRVTETIHLSDLTKILCKMNAEEFSLPSGFTTKYRKRFADDYKSETAFMNLQDGRNSNDINSLHLSSESDVENESKKETSIIQDISISTERTVTSEQKNEARTSKTPHELNQRRVRKGLNASPVAEKMFSANSMAETPVQRVPKDDSPTPLNISISKTAKGKPRKKAALIKLKRGKAHKNFTFHIADGENTPSSSLSKEVSLTLSSSENSLKDSNRESVPNVSIPPACEVDVAHSVCCSDDRVSEVDGHEDSKIEILDSGMSVIFSDTIDRSQTSSTKKMDDIFGIIKDDDYEDGERLHIVETGDENDSSDSDNRLLEIKKETNLDNIVASVVTKMINQVCETLSLSVNLIMEPLRRPNAVTTAESRRVPPLRIRIPQRREPRQRRPARVHDYSPPLPVSRIRYDEALKKRTVVTSAETPSDIGAETQRKRSAANKEGQRKHSLSHNETDVNSRFPQSSNQKSSVLFSSSSFSPSSPVLTGNHEEDTAAIQEVSSDLNPSSLSRSESQSECHHVALGSVLKEGHACELTGRSTRKRPISYEQLYPSLFSRRRKSSTGKTSAVTQLAVFDLAESDATAKLKSGSEESNSVLSGCLPTKQRRKRRRNSTVDTKPADVKLQTVGEKLGLDGSVYDSEEGKDQVISCPRSSNLSDFNHGSCDAAGKKALTDVIKAEISGSSAEEARRSGEKMRRLSSSSVRDGRAPSISDGADQETTISSTKTRRRRVRLDSEGANSNLSQSVSKVQGRKSSTSVDIEGTKSEWNEISTSGRLKNKRTDTKSASDKTKQKVSSQNMPYFKRIAWRRKLNPLAIGLKSRSGDDNPSFFYREILLRGDDLKKDDGGDTIVDVDSELPVEGDDEMPCGRSAISVAFEINRIMPRPEMDCDDFKVENLDHEYVLTLDNIRTIFVNEAVDRKRLLSDMLTVISAQYCSEISSQNVFGGASIRYNTMVKNAHRLRDKVLLFAKDQRVNAKWAHKIFLKHLVVPMLATYIDLLRFCKITGRYMLDFLLELNPSDEDLYKANSYIRDFISEKVLDPQTDAISKTLSKRRAKNICLLTVSPTFTHAQYRSRSRSHEYMFRVLLPNVADIVEPVRLTLPAMQDLSLCEAVDYCIRLVSRKIVEMHRKYPDLKIVLVGWGTSCVINHQVVQCMPNVSAIINFAFPMKTADGPRGDVDDDILLTYCPTLFVIGDQATDCDVRELQVMATRMIAPTGVIVVGSSNCDLHPSTLRLTTERFTHRTVQRALLDDVVDFLQLYCSTSTTHSFRLHPLKLVEVNDVDLSILRTSNLFSGSQTKSIKLGSIPKAGKGECASEK